MRWSGGGNKRVTEHGQYCGDSHTRSSENANWCFFQPALHFFGFVFRIKKIQLGCGRGAPPPTSGGSPRCHAGCGGRPVRSSCGACGGVFSLHSEFPRARAGSHQRRTAAAQLASRAEPPPGGSARGRAPPASANCAAAGVFWGLLAALRALRARLPECSYAARSWPYPRVRAPVP